MKELINGTEELSESVRSQIAEYWSRINLPANSLLLLEGDINDKIYFIEQGLARAFYYKNGKEYTSWIMQEGNFFYSAFSFLNQEPSFETIQLIEPSRLFFIRYTDLQKLLVENLEVNRTWRVLTENNLLRYDIQNRMLRSTTAEERLKKFIEDYPELYGRVPLKYIASYLDITPSSLSRLRSEEMKRVRKNG